MDNDDLPRVTVDSEIFPTQQSFLEVGVIGHENVDEAYQLGTNGGPIIARVQLFQGRNYAEPLKADRMQGRQILARIVSNFGVLPPKGTEVLVGFPRGMEESPGGPVILGTISRVSHTATYGNMQEGDAIVHPNDADSKNRILLKKNGTISLFTQGGGGSIAIQVKATDNSIEMTTPYGAFVIKQNGITCMHGNASGFTLGDNGAFLLGNSVGLNGGNVSLGAAAALHVARGEEVVAADAALLLMVTALETWTATIASAAATGLAVPPTDPTLSAFYTAFAGATTTLIAAITAANATFAAASAAIPSTSVSTA